MNSEFTSFEFNRRTWLLHPAIIFSSIWLTVVLLYSLHLSKWLQYSTSQVFTVISYIWLPFIGVFILYAGLHHFTNLAYPSRRAVLVDLHLLERRLSIWFRLWMLISMVEILVSGGIPLLWLVQGRSKTYMDFGIPSLHGLVNSLLVSVAISRLALFFLTGAKRHLKVPAFVLIWSVLAVTRQLMMISLAEYTIVFLAMRPLHIRTLAKIAAGMALVVLVFGFIGDMRTGSGHFRSLAEPTAQYPDWMPSGVLWSYIYISTPINNLIYTMHSFQPENDALFPKTAATLFPTVVRNLIYGSESAQAESGNLVTQAFNVSTAYVGPFEDYGQSGMIGFSVLISFACMFVWYRRGLRNLLIFAVFTQCLAFSLFFNLFFALPVITQVLWIFYFFMPRMRFGRARSPLPLLN